MIGPTYNDRIREFKKKTQPSFFTLKDKIFQWNSFKITSQLLVELPRSISTLSVLSKSSKLVFGGSMNTLGQISFIDYNKHQTIQFPRNRENQRSIVSVVVNTPKEVYNVDIQNNMRCTSSKRVNFGGVTFKFSGPGSHSMCKISLPYLHFFNSVIVDCESLILSKDKKKIFYQISNKQIWIFDPMTKKFIQRIKLIGSGQHRSISCFCISDKPNCIFYASGNVIYSYDITRRQSHSLLNKKKGPILTSDYWSLSYDQKQRCLVVVEKHTYNKNQISIYRINSIYATPKLLKRFETQRDIIYAEIGNLASNKSLLVCGCIDGFLEIYNIFKGSKAELLVSKRSRNGENIGVCDFQWDFSKGILYLCSYSGKLVSLKFEY